MFAVAVVGALVIGLARTHVLAGNFYGFHDEWHHAAQRVTADAT